jgi:5-formyltetrahydrofolate cyclo-ligase
MPKDKKILRTEILGKRQALGPDERKEKESQILRNITGWRTFKTAGYVCLYNPVRSEADITGLMEIPQFSMYRYFFPRSLEQKGLGFYRTDKTTIMTPGPFGIPEPPVQGLELTDAAVWNGYVLFLCPGTVFDRNGGRLGYGGGYYDRYLSAFRRSHPYTIFTGICFNVQLVDDDLPLEATDVRMDIVITEKGIIRMEEET